MSDADMPPGFYMSGYELNIDEMLRGKGDASSVIDSSYARPEDPKYAKKRAANRESAVRARNKKKVYLEGLEAELAAAQKESNQLKLENAGLRAENQLLKRYLTYFENLFAKKAEAPLRKPEVADIEAKPQEAEVSFVLERA